MKKLQLGLPAGFLPALSMAVLLLWNYFGEDTSIKTALIAEASAFVLPFLVLLILRAVCAQPSRLRLRPFKRQALSLVVFTGVAVSLLGILINYAVVRLGGNYAAAAGTLKGSFGELFLAVALVPALAEEIFFRSGFLGAEEQAGTGPAIVLSAVCFALVHGTLESLPGALTAGLVYGWLSYSLDSVWAAVLAHLINNTLSLLAAYGVNVADELGVWPYFLLAVLFLFCLFFAMSLKTLERLLERGRVPRFKAGSFRRASAALLVNPGVWVLVLLYLVRVFYM